MSAEKGRLRVPRGARVGRFPVMALLQAARYYLLYGDLERAKSFGLNRAIFYAWAKYYGPHTGHYQLKRRETMPREVREIVMKLRERGESLEKPRVVTDREGRRWMILFEGNEAVPVSPRGWFEMGGKEQTPRDFDRHVAASFEAVGVPFQVAWEAALDYLKQFPREVLLSPSRFYRYVYEPVRDTFIDSVVRPFVEKKYGSVVEEKPAASSTAASGVQQGGAGSKSEEKSSEGKRIEGSTGARGTRYGRVRRLDEFLKRS